MIDVYLGDEPAPSVVVPTPAPQPQPAPVTPVRPVSPPAAPSRPGLIAWVGLVLLGLAFGVGVGIAGTLLGHYLHPVPPVAAVDAYSTGKTFAPKFLSVYADAYDAAADALEKGATVKDAQDILQDKWKTARTKQFMAVVTPTFESILPQGQEPADEKKRAEVVKTWRDFARGMRGQ